MTTRFREGAPALIEIKLAGFQATDQGGVGGAFEML